jgi:hypothetical protein
VDYTTTARVKSELHVTGSGDDALIGQLVTAASRSVDRLCTGSPKAVDYFALADVTNERLHGVVDVDGNINVWPRKSPVNSVATFAYRQTPVEGWLTVDLTNPDFAEIVGPYAVKAWSQLLRRPKSLQVMMSYNGGFAAATADMPADLQELTTLFAGRCYREAEGNLADAIGVATIGSIQFTKAVPERFEYLLQQFRRSVAYDY